MAKDIKLSRLAEELGISSRSVSAWVYEGRIPSNNNIDKTCRLLGYPPHILFNEALIRQSPIVCQPTPSRFMKRSITSSPRSNVILTGLCMVYDFSVTDVSIWIGVHPGTFRKWLHNSHLPTPALQEKAEAFFPGFHAIFYLQTAERSNTILSQNTSNTALLQEIMRRVICHTFFLKRGHTTVCKYIV